MTKSDYLLGTAFFALAGLNGYYTLENLVQVASIRAVELHNIVPPEHWSSLSHCQTAGSIEGVVTGIASAAGLYVITRRFGK